jgi:hypothetical protein
MKKGTQIAYIPNHVSREDADFLSHPDVEFGFVTSQHPKNDSHFCRFWYKGKPGVLLTTTSSQIAMDRNLIEFDSVPPNVVEETLEWIEHALQASQVLHPSAKKGL